MRIPFLLLLMLPLFQAAEILSPAERKEIAELVNAVMAAGFPDAAKATLYRGELRIRATSGPHGEEPLLPCDSSQMQETTETGVAYNFVFPGMHAKTASGTWLIGFDYNFSPRPTDEVTEAGLTVITPATLTETAQAERNFDAAKDAKEWLEPLSATDRPHLIAVMDRLVPVSFYLKINLDTWPAATVLLHRAGWPDAELAALSIADQRARSFWKLRPWSEPEPAFDPTGAYPNAKQEEQAWKDAHKILTLESPAIALRRGLFRFFKSHINRDDAWMSPDVATACCLACLDPNDPQGNQGRIAALRAVHDLPVILPPQANLVARLQSWEAAPRRPRMAVRNGKNAKGDGTVGMSTSFAAPAPAYQPHLSDLDALIALLDDQRPTRWIDFTGARSVGDNAWRAVSTLVERDPRLLAGIPVDKPWSPTERTTAARAFQAWWKVHGTTQRGLLKAPQEKP